jgi:hypothetical protein
MAELPTPGQPQGIPAGNATQSLVGGLPTIVLSANVAEADIISFTGLLTVQNIIVQIPPAVFPTQVSSTASYSAPLNNAWIKLFHNTTTGNFAVLVQNQGAATSLAIPQGGSLLVYSPDGVNVFAGDAGSGGVLGMFRGSTAVDTTTAAGPIDIPGSSVTAVFNGTRILVQVDWAGDSDTIDRGVFVTCVDSVTGIQPKTAKGISITAHDVVGTAISYLIANTPGTLHTIKLQLTTQAGANAQISALSSAVEYANITCFDLA